MKLPQKKRVTSGIAVALVTVLTMGLCIGASIQSPATAESKTAVQLSSNESQTGQIDTLVLKKVATSLNEVLAAHASNGVETVSVEEPTPLPLDRTKPIYAVYKNGYELEVPADLQWYIRDMATQYGFNERHIYGCIAAESGFNPSAKGDGGKSLGLAQIQKFWIRGANIPRFTENYRDRNLLDPYDNILTLMELWCYARESYNIDTGTDSGARDLFYWHNTGKYIKNVNWAYSNKVLGFANELVQLQ